MSVQRIKSHFFPMKCCCYILDFCNKWSDVSLLPSMPNHQLLNFLLSLCLLLIQGVVSNLWATGNQNTSYIPGTLLGDGDIETNTTRRSLNNSPSWEGSWVAAQTVVIDFDKHNAGKIGNVRSVSQKAGWTNVARGREQSFTPPTIQLDRKNRLGGRAWSKNWISKDKLNNRQKEKET